MATDMQIEAGWRIARACLVAAGWAIACFFFVEWARPDSGVVSVSFAIIQPAAINAFLACVADPMRRRPLRFYLLIPVVSAIGMVLVSIFVLQEGAVCIAMLSPLWIGFGMIGAWLAYTLRPRAEREADLRDTFAVHGLLVLPMLALILEGLVPVPIDTRTVTREVVIAAPAEDIWPLMQGMGDVPDNAGHWTVSHSIIGLPRPALAKLDGKGIGARRHARWQHGVRFDEVVDGWQEGRAIHWQFDFAQSAGWEITDPHLRPDGPYMRILSGGYDLEPLGDGRHLLSLHTTYEAQTHFNGYASLWGELFLGDIHDNVLAVIRQRAEGAI
ncbi:SRPBCC family protein [Aurantiacibacter aquimixticola]|uniref:SRPBCC family protein n=1 Tax=Aurantiacibacter aquimixticola TaxID=1958945 RepID=A0A419RVC2_9SPHN|nr:SRPBCC family protein [Aurantiacibacter aquimixticola]RJY09738.1 SRPBCC family protein [Aurantiacibacter aquimixticola]